MIRCRTLGPVVVTLEGAPPPPELLWRKNLALLVYLARSPDRRRTRDHLVGLLWGDREQSAARHSLREAVRVLRRALGEEGVETAGDQIRLPAGALELDTDRFDRHATAGEWGPAAELVGGEFLEGFGIPDASAFEDWLAAERSHWRRRGGEALVRCAGARLAGGDARGAVEMARRALDSDTGSDRAAQVAMQGLAVAGDRGAALELYERFAGHFKALGSGGPDTETRALAERLRQGRRWQLPEHLATMRAAGGEDRRAPLVGAERELSTMLDQWRKGVDQGRCRIVLLDGEPGLGKTRLSEEVALRAALDGAAVARVRAVAGDRTQPFSAILGLARGGLLDALGVGGARPEALAALAAELPEWADRYGAALKGLVPLPIGAGFIEVLRAVGAEQPLLLVVDDAEGLDESSFRTLEGAIRDLARAPIIVLLTTASQSGHVLLDDLRSHLGRDIEGATLTLRPLGTNALTALARWALPRFSEEEVARVTRRVAADSAGIPLLAIELFHAIALGLDLHETPGAWPAAQKTLDQTLPGELPETVVAAIRVGVRRLSKEAQAALLVAAVLGERVPATTIGKGAGLEGDALAVALDELEWQRWLVSEPRGYAFVARIVREVVARDMVSAGQRQRILDACH